MYFPVLASVSTPGVYYAFQNSDAVGKGIVVLLIVTSVITWTIMLDKAMSLGRAGKMAARFVQQFRANQRLVNAPELRREAERSQGPTSVIYQTGIAKLERFYEDAALQSGNRTMAPAMPCKLSAAQYDGIEAMLESCISGQIQQLETRIGVLATMVSVCPFCGLFGTVWGVMLAFCGIAVAGRPDFSALAPGVAGALLTTVAGLIVAIPSLIGYNMLNAQIRTITVTMDNFAEEFMARVKIEQLELYPESGNASGEERH